MAQRENDPINAPKELGTVPEDHRYILKGIEDLAPGDHLCFIYRTEKEHREFMTRYIQGGLLKNEKVLYIFHDHKPSTIMHYLEQMDVNIKNHIEKGQFRALTVDESYMKGGVFEPDTMIEMVEAESQKALDEGYSALRVTGEMTWALSNLPGSERLIEYEAKLNTIFQSSKLIGLCQYNRYKFDPEFLMEVVATHPFVVYDSEIYSNYNFIEAARFLHHDRAPIILDNSLRNLATRKRLEIELRDKARKLLETIEFPVWVWKKIGDDFILDYYNQSSFALRTANFKGLTGKMFREMFSEYPELIEDIETCYEEKRVISREMTFRLGNEGEMRHFLCTFVFMEPSMILMKGIDISSEKQVKEKLKDSEGKYQELMSILQEGVWTIDAENNTTYVSEYMAYLLGYKPEEMIGKNLFEFMDENWKKICANNTKRRKDGIRENHEFEFVRKDGNRIYTTLTTAPLRDKDKRYAGAIATVRDITKERIDQMEKRKKQMRFHLEERNMYIVKEPTSGLSGEVFKDLLKVGLKGYVISRTPKREFGSKIEGKYNYIQMGERLKTGRQSISPKAVLDFVESVAQGSVILLDRFDFIISKLGFKKALSFIYSLKDLTYNMNLISIISIDPSVLHENEMHMLEKECKGVEPSVDAKLPEDLEDIIKFVNERNLSGIKPTLSVIGQRFELTKPTIRRKIRELSRLDLIAVHEHGRTKVVELTQRGKDILLK